MLRKVSFFNSYRTVFAEPMSSKIFVEYSWLPFICQDMQSRDAGAREAKLASCEIRPLVEPNAAGELSVIVDLSVQLNTSDRSSELLALASP